MPVTVETYPDFLDQVRSLVDQHRGLKNERLRLAVYYAPQRAKADIFLLEVIDGFGGDAIDPDQKIFEFGYGSTPGFQLPPDTSLRMLLTSPAEWHEAAENHWKAIEELRKARKAGRATVIFADAKGKRLWDMIK